ncbi:transcription initiation factor TFIID subunit 11 [Panicum miliaceum]|uniref:Transcription initiation factor TFIID subunit 11 n=1 Tax=Panicum miliaceum TaxID=4540 RepID=A0A3L6R1K1_PANMI|nr:transcription initiation factor TFIID subunit 11 [Panicum miliaceum]
MKDPFEAAVEEQDSPPESPAPPEEEAGAAGPAEDPEDYDGGGPRAPPPRQPAAPASLAAAAAKAKGRVQREQQEDEDDEEDQMEVDLEKLPTSTGDPDKLAKMKFVPYYALPVQHSYLVNYTAFAILSQFTEEQMNRYESFRRSGFQKSNMKRLLTSITGSQKISIPTSIVVSGIAKMFVGELIETGKFRIVVLIVMTERKDSGPIRPCHIREAYRRLKLEGKIPRRSVPRLFR